MTENCNRRLILPLQLCGTACAGPSAVIYKNKTVRSGLWVGCSPRHIEGVYLRCV